MLELMLEEKYRTLRGILAGMRSVAIGYSGGVDSTLLLKVAFDELGPGVLAMIGQSATYPTREFEEAVALALHRIRMACDRSPKLTNEAVSQYRREIATVLRFLRREKNRIPCVFGPKASADLV